MTPTQSSTEATQDQRVRWADKELALAYRLLEEIRQRLNQPVETEIDIQLKRALDAVESADFELGQCAAEGR